MKDTFFKSALILLIGGALTKMLGMLIKIIMTRIVGIDGVSIYMLVFPTFSLFMTIAELGFPTAISKLISEETHNNKNLILSIIPLSLIFNIILMVVVITMSPVITHFINDPRALYPIMSIALVLPFDSLSSILRGYFFGKQKMIPHILSLITEQIIRLLFILLIVPSLLSKGIVVTVSSLIGINMLSEFISTLVLLLFIKNKKISKEELKLNKKEIKNVLSISIPTTLSRLIGSISYFFEPIIITTTLINQGYLSSFVIKEYGIIEGFVLPLLLIPSFLTNALSGALIPDISKRFVKRDLLAIKRRIKQVIKLTLIIGIVSLSIIYLNPSYFLKLIYKIDEGSNYLKVLAPFFIILYIQNPLENILQAINKSKSVMLNNIIGTLTKLLSIFIFSFFKIGLYNLIIGIILSILITTYLHYRAIKKELNASLV